MNPIEVNIQEVKTTVSNLLLPVQPGEDEVIAKRVPMPSLRPPLGTLKGLYSVPDSFLDPLSESELREWE